MATTSSLRTRMSTEAINNGGLPWSENEAMTELLVEAQAGGTGTLAINRATAQTKAPAAVCAVPCVLLGYNFINPNTYPVYVKLYDNVLSSVTVGLSTPLRVFAVPSSGYLNQENTGAVLASFTKAITMAVTKNLADSDTIDVDTPIYAELFYK